MGCTILNSRLLFLGHFHLSKQMFAGIKIVVIVLFFFNHRHLQDYAKWQLLYYWMPFLKQDMANLYYEFQRLTNPSSPVPLTWNEQCMQDVQRMMPYALGRVFAQYLLHNNSKVHFLLCYCFLHTTPSDDCHSMPFNPFLSQNAASLMMTNIMQAFRDRIGSRSWLDKKTISVAQDKVFIQVAC